jgi:hypothetical protein
LILADDHSNTWWCGRVIYCVNDILLFELFSIRLFCSNLHQLVS